MLYMIIAVLVIILDQWIKLYVSTGANLPAEGVVLIPNVIRLVDVKNDGAAFGLLSGSNTMVFIILTAVIVVLVFVALATKFISGKLARWSLVMIAAGGVSNCIDRIINFNPTGYVQDMFQFEFAPWFPVFNLADIFITVFCILFILAILFGRDRSDDEALEDEFAEDEEEDEEEEEKPRRKERRKKARKLARADYEDDDEDEDEDEEEEPARPAPASRKARQARYEEEYEQYKAQQRARQQQAAEEAAKAQAQQQAAPAQPDYNPADPFAEWERANARQQQAAKPQRPAASAAQPKPAERPAVPAQPAVKPAVKTPEPAVEESFSLDDILAEFK